MEHGATLEFLVDSLRKIADSSCNNSAQNTLPPETGGIPISREIPGPFRTQEELEPPPLPPQPPQQAQVANPDEYHSELNVVAFIIAYFKVSVKRVIDIVPMCIENEFLCSFVVDLREKLVDNLQLWDKSGVGDARNS